MRFLFVCVYMAWCFVNVSAKDYDGNNVLSVLGQTTSSQLFKEFKEYWLLDKDYQNFARGIKIYINPISDKAESIIIAGDNVGLGGSSFKKYIARLPFEINLENDTAQLAGKLGHGEKLIGRSTIRFYHDNVTIEATFTDLKNGKISFLKFSKEAKRPEPASVPPPTQPHKESIADKHRQIEQNTFLTGTKPSPKPVKPALNQTPFKQALMDVFKASRESSFDSIKNGERTDGNFWNYKYTYNTSLKIPGEKYNMLYSYPFVTSQLDFVVVLKESDSFEKSFATMYHDFEKQLTENFPASEGWISSCLPGKDKSQLPDLEFRNDKYGAIILDHSQNPRGRHVLYLRFLLFSD